DVPYGLVSRPLSAVSKDFARIESPRARGPVEFVTERRVIETDGLRLPVRAPLRDGLHDILIAAFAAPVAVGEIDARLGLRRDDVLMRYETLVQMRLMHVVGQHPFVCHVEVRLRIGMREVDVLGVRRAAPA